MAEDSKIILNSDDQSLGTIQIAPRVLEIIAGIAACPVTFPLRLSCCANSGTGIFFSIIHCQSPLLARSANA